jgi:colanic acid/amylovoran biosynthesis glycosyltransferase
VTFVDYATLHDYLKDFDAFIHASCYADSQDCEGGAPVVVLDAQATDLPVIATTHCDIPSEVVHGVTGLLSEQKNVNKLAENSHQFCLANDVAFQEFSTAAIDHVKKSYSIKSNCEALRGIYEGVNLDTH